MDSSENSVRRLADRLIQALDCDACQGYVRKYSESMDKIESLLSEAMQKAFSEGVSENYDASAAYTVKPTGPRRDRIKEARSAAYRDAADEVNSYMYEKGLSVQLIDLADKLRRKASE